MGSNTPSELPVIIIGGGPAGLTLAQGLRNHSIPFRLFERNAKEPIRSQGHRFRASKEAFSALRSVLPPQVRDLLNETAPTPIPYAPRYVDAHEFDFPVPRKLDTQDFVPVDRSWLRYVLSSGIEDSIEYDKAFERYELQSDGIVQVVFADGSFSRGRLLVGSDGIHSRVRSQLQPSRRLLDVDRWTLWGRTPLTEDLRRQIPDDTFCWFMAHGKATLRLVVMDPIVWTEESRRRLGNYAAQLEDYIFYAIGTNSFSSLPSTDSEKEEFRQMVTKDVHPTLQLMIRSGPVELSRCVPILSSKPEIEMSSNDCVGTVTLVGDAAHPMSPSGGMGGSTSFINAADLASTIAEEGISKASLREFEARMSARAKEKIEYSFENGKKFWSGGEWYECAEVPV